MLPILVEQSVENEPINEQQRRAKRKISTNHEQLKSTDFDAELKSLKTQGTFGDWLKFLIFNMTSIYSNNNDEIDRTLPSSAEENGDQIVKFLETFIQWMSDQNDGSLKSDKSLRFLSPRYIGSFYIMLY